MLREHWRLISRAQRAGDLLIIVVSFFAAYYGRDSLLFWDEILGWGLPFSGPALAPLKDYFLVLIIALIGYMFTLQALGAYNSMRLTTSWGLLRISLVSSVLVFVILAASLFLLKIDLSRSFILLFCMMVALTLCAERFVVLELLRFWRKRGKNYRNVLICGCGEQALRLVKEIAMRPELGIRIRGFAALGVVSSTVKGKFKEELKIFEGKISNRMLSGVSAVEKGLKQFAIDEVIFTDVVEVLPLVSEVAERCAEEGVRTTLAADLFSMGLVKSGLSYFGGIPLIHFQTPPGDQWELSVKRFLDILVSGILLIGLAPFLLLIGLAVRLSSPGPILFRQRRVGLNGRIFYLYKFRSMKHNAEDELSALLLKNEMQGPAFKISDDPRITPLGKILRRHSLDELPQLWNVFVGDMSLVGPRPPIPGEVSMYERRDRRRLSMRPGLTCTWQVSGRNKIKDFEEWVKLDLAYIDNWSLTKDLALLAKTVPVVLFGAGGR